MNIKKILFVLSIFTTSLLAFYPMDVSAKSLPDYFKEFPWLGLIADEVTYGPVTISHFNINQNKKVAIVGPGEKVYGSLRYKIDSDKADFSLCHLVIGIEGVGAQDCIAHTFNLWDSKGKGKFTLVAPKEPGVYQVRFLFFEGITCSKARDSWDKGEDPSAAATLGVIIVK